MMRTARKVQQLRSRREGPKAVVVRAPPARPWWPLAVREAPRSVVLQQLPPRARLIRQPATVQPAAGDGICSQELRRGWRPVWVLVGLGPRSCEVEDGVELVAADAAGEGGHRGVHLGQAVDGHHACTPRAR